MKSKLLGVIIFSTVVWGTAVNAAAQDSTSSPQPANKPSKEVVGPDAESIRPYRPTNRDPFKRTIRPKGPKPKTPSSRVLGFPTLDARRAEFRQKAQQAVASDRAEPDPVSQYLVSEVDITGVFRDDRGFGAFVRAQPTGTMFFVRNGSRLYNGEVLRIMADEGDGSARVQFREVSYVEVNGKQAPQDRVVVKVSGTSSRH